MSRPSSDAPIVSLRAALASPFPDLRVVAVELVRSARGRRSTVGAAAYLGVSRRALQRLLADFPEAAE
jgi:hypothetical protein